jgi:hypothetical protein
MATPVTASIPQDSGCFSAKFLNACTIAGRVTPEISPATINLKKIRSGIDRGA